MNKGVFFLAWQAMAVSAVSIYSEIIDHLPEGHNTWVDLTIPSDCDSLRDEGFEKESRQEGNPA
jgi:hypothetical protein